MDPPLAHIATATTLLDVSMRLKLGRDDGQSSTGTATGTAIECIRWLAGLGLHWDPIVVVVVVVVVGVTVAGEVELDPKRAIES